jgi:putative ABC transport system substrate-binding protein
MRRIGLVTLVASLIVAPLAGEAQSSRPVPTIAVVYGNNPESEILGPCRSDRQAIALVQAMSRLGWVEGQNITIVWRSAEGRPDRYSTIAKGLANTRLNLIVVAGGPPLLRALQQAVNTIPIVMAGTFNDPVEGGVARSLARPGGNVTGLTTGASGALNDKRLELLKETVPRISRVAYLMNSGMRVPHDAAGTMRLTFLQKVVNSREELEPALADIARQRVDAVLVANGIIFWAQRYALVEFAARARLPAIYPYDVYTRAGGLLSYGANHVELFGRVAPYVDKIL